MNTAPFTAQLLSKGISKHFWPKNIWNNCWAVPQTGYNPGKRVSKDLTCHSSSMKSPKWPEHSLPQRNSVTTKRSIVLCFSASRMTEKTDVLHWYPWGIRSIMSLFPTFPDGFLIAIVCLKGKSKVKNLILKNLYRECIADTIIKHSDKMIILLQSEIYSRMKHK